MHMSLLYTLYNSDRTRLQRPITRDGCADIFILFIICTHIIYTLNIFIPYINLFCIIIRLVSFHVVNFLIYNKIDFIICHFMLFNRKKYLLINILVFRVVFLSLQLMQPRVVQSFSRATKLLLIFIFESHMHAIWVKLVLLLKISDFLDWPLHTSSNKL